MRESTSCPQCGELERIAVHANVGSGVRYMCKGCGKTWTVRGAVAGADSPGLTIEGNRASLVSKPSNGPPRAEDVMSDFGLSEDDWIIEKVRPGMHEMGYKDAKGEGRKMRLYNLKLWLIRRVPAKCEWPQIAGAVIKSWKPKVRLPRKKMKRAVVIPDMHVGYRRTDDGTEPMHDLAACAIASRIIRDQEPDLVVLLGDNLDLADWSDKFIVTPDCKFLTQDSLNFLASWIHGWRSSTDRVVYLEGNHEWRLPKALASNCQAAYGLKPANLPDANPALSIPNLLGLDDLEVEWVGGFPKNHDWINENLRARHADELAKQPGQTVGKSLQHSRASSAFGHAHRVESAHTTVHGFDKIRVYGAYCFGTLARLDDLGPPSGGKETNWQQCVGIIDYMDESPHLFNVQQHLIYDGKCIVEGTLYESEVT